MPTTMVSIPGSTRIMKRVHTMSFSSPAPKHSNDSWIWDLTVHPFISILQCDAALASPLLVYLQFNQSGRSPLPTMIFLFFLAIGPCTTNRRQSLRVSFETKQDRLLTAPPESTAAGAMVAAQSSTMAVNLSMIIAAS
ncbi:hypothetical protein EW146_g8554 [Bondarzewia mesenterica]|uniref:Uncharacterized protein n=1 Tax=Bondarzewia mesenterica TaxID=1095465 RepID=A0A4S4LDX3_9AGAM|nr:hypothetical protein EW146_g8554 [Bondarzewia mesenterica]